MTPQERAKWCIEQAEEIERDLSERAQPDGLMTMPELQALWWRDMAFRVLQGTEGRA